MEGKMMFYWMKQGSSAESKQILRYEFKGIANTTWFIAKQGGWKFCKVRIHLSPLDHSSLPLPYHPGWGLKEEKSIEEEERILTRVSDGWRWMKLIEHGQTGRETKVDECLETSFLSFLYFCTSFKICFFKWKSKSLTSFIRSSCLSSYSLLSLFQSPPPQLALVIAYTSKLQSSWNIFHFHRLITTLEFLQNTNYNPPFVEEDSNLLPPVHHSFTSTHRSLRHSYPRGSFLPSVRSGE